MRKQQDWLAGALLLLISAGLVLWAFAYMVYDLDIPLGTDYIHSYRPAAQLALDGHGETLYQEDDTGYYNLPWFLVVFLPLELVSGLDAVIIWNSASLFLLLIAIDWWRRSYPAPTFAVVMAVINIHTIDLLVRSQIDVFIMFAAVMGWFAVQQGRPLLLGLALSILTAKALNVILLMLVLALMIRKWRWQEWLVVLAPTALLAVGSFFIFGLDYPLRYLRYNADNPPADDMVITLWKAAEQTSIPPVFIMVLVLGLLAAFFYYLWRFPITAFSFGLAICTMLVVTLYANGNHYLLLVPVLLLVAAYNPRLALVAYAFTWTPLLRLVYGNDGSWVDIGYPLFLLLSLWIIIYREQIRAAAGTNAQATAPPVSASAS